MTEPYRTTDSPMAMPTFRRTLLLAGRAACLKCPHCGGGPVLARLTSWREWGSVRHRCATCNFRFERSDDSYFSGAMITNLLMSELLFAIGFCTAVVASWPNVPWDALTWIAAAGMIAAPVILFPFARVLWLTVDVLVRPVLDREMA